MEDVNKDITQVQRNQVFLADHLTIEGRDLKKFDKTSIFTIGGNSRAELVTNSENGDDDDDNSDIISDHIGHIGKWQLFWAIIMCLFQFPTTFHIFCLVFQVSCCITNFKTKVKLTALISLDLCNVAYCYNFVRNFVSALEDGCVFQGDF